MLSFGISPCPNDIFIFFGMLNRKIRIEGLEFKFFIEDVETLNSLCMKNFLDISKISAHTYYHLKNHYEILSSGGAFSEYGPVAVAKEPDNLKNLQTVRIALPGRLTTASALMWFYWKKNFHGKKYVLKFMPFYKIIDSLINEETDMGVLIHEARFIYPVKGLKLIADLGKFWIEETSLPVPLGCIITKKSLKIKKTLENIIRKSLNYAYSHPEEALNFSKKYSQESGHVIKLHIDYYVNKYTAQMGKTGNSAINELMKRIEREGVWS